MYKVKRWMVFLGMVFLAHIACVASLSIFSPSHAQTKQSLRPVARQSQGAASTVSISSSVAAVLSSLLPLQRPAKLPRPKPTKDTQNTTLTVCGNNRIQGKLLAPIYGKIQGCGVQNPVQVTAVSGIRLSVPATMDCQTAKALNTWVSQDMIPAFKDFRSGVRELHVVAHYICRTRNNRAGAKISEHGKGRAIDIAGFRMVDGSKITLLKDWGRERPGDILHQLHRTACTRFGTVLGPNANRAHRDHFHFDTAHHSNGSYCR